MRALAILCAAGLSLAGLAGCCSGFGNTSDEKETSWAGGAGLSSVTPTPVKTLIGSPADYRDKKIEIEGVVTKVCQGRGCWVEVSDGGSKLIARSIGDEVLFPKDCAGQAVRVYGTFRIDPPKSCKGDHSSAKDHECPQPKLLLEIHGAALFHR